MECGKNENYPIGLGCRNRVEVVNGVLVEQETEPRAGLELLVRHWIHNSEKQRYGELITELMDKLTELRKIAGRN